MFTLSEELKFAMAAPTSNSTRSFKLRGKVYRLSKADVERAAAKIDPRATDKYAVMIAGRAYPPKQLIEETLQLPPVAFTTLDAQRILAKLGFEIVSPRKQLVVDSAAGSGAFLDGTLDRMAGEARARELLDAYLYASGVSGLSIQREPLGQGAKPDFVLTVKDKRIALEVKELIAADFDLASEVGLYDPCRPIRRRIAEAEQTLAGLPDASRSLVLHSRCTPWPIFEWRLIYGAMRGAGDASDGSTKTRERRGVDDEKASRVLDAVIVLDQLRTGYLRFRAHIGALEAKTGRPLTDTEYMAELYKARGTERDVILTRLRVVVHEHPNPKRRLPAEIFCGPYDERFGMQEDGRIGRIFVGEEIRLLEKDGLFRSP